MADWTDITAAIGLALAGERQRGREELERCWEGTGEDDHAQRCVLAHYLADLQPDLEQEVRWDELALAAYGHLADADLMAVGIPHSRGLAPSLHLNLGDGYLRQGRSAHARAQLEAGLANRDAPAADGYGEMIRKGLTGLEERLTQRLSAPPVSAQVEG